MFWLPKTIASRKVGLSTQIPTTQCASTIAFPIVHLSLAAGHGTGGTAGISRGIFRPSGSAGRPETHAHLTYLTQKTSARASSQIRAGDSSITIIQDMVL